MRKRGGLFVAGLVIGLVIGGCVVVRGPLPTVRAQEPAEIARLRAELRALRGDVRRTNRILCMVMIEASDCVDEGKATAIVRARGLKKELNDEQLDFFRVQFQGLLVR